MKAFTTSRAKNCLWMLAAAALWLALWHLGSRAVGQPLLLPAPAKVLARLASLPGEPGFWGIVGGSMGRILLGFLAGLALGTAIAALTARWKLFYHFFSLPMNIIKATPVASFVILVLLWIKGRSLSIFIAFLMVLPLVWSNVHEGIVRTDPKLLEMARVYRLPRLCVMKHIVIPSVLPYFLSAVRVGLGFSWKAGVAGEVITFPSGAIGTQLYNAKVYLETADLFAWTAVIILLSVLLERVMVALLGLLTRRLARLTEQEGAA